MVDHAADLTAALGLNYSEFPNSCPRIEFALVVNIPQVLVYGRNRYGKQLGNESLGQPDRPLLNADRGPRPPVICGIKEELTARHRQVVAHRRTFPSRSPTS